MIKPRLKEAQLAQGVIRYREWGSGEPILFVHGLLVNGELWRKVAPPLADGFRCIVPDWPLGSHPVPMDRNADLTPQGLARLIVDFTVKLGLEPVTLVGNDTGGALCQMVVAHYPEWVARLVLTDCDVADNFLPPLFRYLQWGAHLPGFVFLMGQALRLPPLRRLPIAYGWLTKYPLDREASAAYTRPVTASGLIRRDLAKVLKGISPQYTLATLERFAGFQKPVLLAWATEDPFFPLEHAKQLHERFPKARLECIEDSHAFIPEDQPGRLVEVIRAFMGERLTDNAGR